MVDVCRLAAFSKCVLLLNQLMSLTAKQELNKMVVFVKYYVVLCLTDGRFSDRAKWI